jgi:hypothetical protein
MRRRAVSLALFALTLAVAVVTLLALATAGAMAQATPPRSTPVRSVPGEAWTAERGGAVPRGAVPGIERITPQMQATMTAQRLNLTKQPGETVNESVRRAGLVTECDQTRGKSVKAYGRDVQLPADTCVTGTIFVTPGKDHTGPTTLVAVDQGGKRGHLTPDGRIVVADVVIAPGEPTGEPIK